MRFSQFSGTEYFALLLFSTVVGIFTNHLLLIVFATESSTFVLFSFSSNSRAASAIAVSFLLVGGTPSLFIIDFEDALLIKVSASDSSSHSPDSSQSSVSLSVSETLKLFLHFCSFLVPIWSYRESLLSFSGAMVFQAGLIISIELAIFSMFDYN